MTPEGPPLDLRLLGGFSFRCRPDCGLCCFTTPSVSPVEASRLLQIDPSAPVRAGDRGSSFVESRPNGGACHFLRGVRCRVHPARPTPCREFPVTVHLGERAQATAVLSCPGLAPGPWGRWAEEGGAGPGPIGLDEEIDAAREGLSAVPWVRWSEEGRRRWRSVRRRLARAGGWMEPEDLRDRLRPRLLEIARSGFPAEPPPDRSEGLEVLPLFYDPALGCLAITDHPGGVELLVLREDGGDPVPAGAWAVPDRSPDCDADADRTLRGYLDYLLARDFTYWAAAARAGDDDRLIDLVEEDLGRFGALVLARAWVRRAMTHPTRGRLDASAILDGIRATDAEFLDRPTLGRIL